jgi:periplasmic copper chaperone A
MTDLKAMTMLRNATDHPRAAHSRATGSRSALARTSLVAVLLVLGAALAGCSAAQASGSPIELATAYVGQPQGSSPTDAYLVIRNNGEADRLVSARTSVGGTVTLRGPAGRQPGVMRNVSALPIPAHSFMRLDPNGFHLVISGAGRMKPGTDITLTLVFAKAGPVQVAAEVTNPQTGGSSYFLN